MFDFWPRKSNAPNDSEETTFLKSTKRKLPEKYQGWRFGVLTCTVSTCLVLLINIFLPIGALAQHGWGRDGQPILYEGKCNTVSQMSTGLHLLINAMSTTLLCASSYCMQCLSSPTRKELDRAHKKKSWLDVGVLSPRNIRSISKSRRIRWLILGLSTVPLHLFYNSIVFASTGATLYYPLLVRETLLKPDTVIEPFNSTRREAVRAISFSSPDFVEEANGTYASLEEAKRLRDIYARGGLQRLENRDCFKAYTTQFQTRGSVFLVTTNDSFSDHFLSYFSGPWVTQDWACSAGSCDESSATELGMKDFWKHPETWSFDGVRVAYCLSETPAERCRLQLSLPIAIIVVFFNAMKAICMVTILLRLGEKMNDPPVMNLGDTVASFLDRSDTCTKNMGMTSLDNLRKALNMSHRWDTRAKEVKRKRAFRFGAASRTRWILTVVLYSTILTIAIWVTQDAISTTAYWQGQRSSATATSFAIMKSIGWGKVDVRTMININTKALITNAVIANAPQLVLSWVYFSYNGLLTLLALAREWESYAQKRKGLRVSSVPCGEQRSTYFLQLPYRIAVPFMIISGFLHWIISQSFFLVSVQLYAHSAAEGWKERLDNPATRVSIGYSLLPMVVGVVVGGCLLVGILAVGFTRFETAMPVVSSCSAAISAACQPLEEDDSEAATSAVQWGVVGYFPKGLEHCGFARGAVQQPVVGRRYR
ncbi:hypothetical protein CC86DRAFT_327712 [Ophiobolus disseminans]|uniref:DUF6536 domain-containing protein n=1 Tax=Ophiobolus disseminans TaxID=1469910 RepID=A0A6A6ZTL2_9PLEO|nr:hypothetical protein CC86DRAFT_327712 [Ophiobolus disseminans]